MLWQHVIRPQKATGPRTTPPTKEEMTIRLLIEKEMITSYWFIQQPTKEKMIKLATTSTIHRTLYREITNS